VLTYFFVAQPLTARPPATSATTVAIFKLPLTWPIIVRFISY
jgi:hypothetical protein